MKYMVLSDLHGALDPFLKCQERMVVEAPDYVILLGDLLYHGPRNPLPKGHDPQGLVKALNSIKANVIAVRGNCDAEVDQMLLEFPIMSDYVLMMDATRQVFLTHGHVYNVNQMPSLRMGAIMFQGHTHIPGHDEKDGIHILNPGSIALPKGGAPATYGIFEDNQFVVKTLDGEVYLNIEL